MKCDFLDFEKTYQIDQILESAFSQGRMVLYEQEVYRILKILDLNSPAHIFVKDISEITPKMLASFGSDTIFLKIVSPDIFHKAKIGGVRQIYKDTEFCKYVCEKMIKEVSNHPDFTSPPSIEGILITERIKYSKELGNEALISFKESLAYGPVISFSKGGADTEHFARHYSAPNLKLAPLSFEESGKLIENTKIYLKFIEDEHFDYPQKITEAMFKLSQLAACFSSFNPNRRKFVFSEFEVNPFVFDYSGNLVAIDGLAVFEADKTTYRVATVPNITNLDSFIRPHGVAIIGVSASDQKKMGNIIATLMSQQGRDDIYMVNPRGGEVTIENRIYPLYKSLWQIEDHVDLAVITIPAQLTPDAVRDAVKKGVRGIVLIPGGFGEVSGDTTLEEEVLALIEGTDIRILGPNCLGVFFSGDDTAKPLNTIFIPKERLEIIPKKESNVALISQSGAMGITEMDRLKHAIYPKVLITYGNQLDIDPGDLVEYFDKQSEVDIIALYIEGFKAFGGREFFNVALDVKKPIIIYKAGRTDAGSKAAASHTASMTGDYEEAKAMFHQCGAIVAETILDHKDFIKIFSLLWNSEIKGKRVAGVVNAGFEGTYAADTLGNLELAEFTEETKNRLREILPSIVSINPILDITPMADDELFAQCCEIVLEDSNTDILFASIVPLTPQMATGIEDLETRRENVAQKLGKLRKKTSKPIVVSVNAGTMYSHLVSTLEDNDIPSFTTAERAMFCLNKLVEVKLKRD